MEADGSGDVAFAQPYFIITLEFIDGPGIDEQVAGFANMGLQIAACALPPRRARSCQRKVRQPVNKWPRMMTPSSLGSPSLYDVTMIA